MCPIFVMSLQNQDERYKSNSVHNRVEICTFVSMIKLKSKSDDLVLFSKEYAVQINCAQTITHYRISNALGVFTHCYTLKLGAFSRVNMAIWVLKFAKKGNKIRFLAKNILKVKCGFSEKSNNWWRFRKILWPSQNI